MSQQLSTNTFGCAKWIVSSDATQGTHTTIAGALTSASSGDTIFIRPGTYTENLTLKAGVNLTAFFDGYTPNVIILGTCTMTTAGTVTISGVQLKTNGAAFLSITGSAASVVQLINCNLNALNSNGITASSSGAGAQVTCVNCTGDLGSNTSFFAISNGSSLTFRETYITNTGGSTTVSTATAGTLTISSSGILFPITTSGTAACALEYTNFDTATQGSTITLTAGGSGSQEIRFCRISSGGVSAISAGTILAIKSCEIVSSAGNAITGAGTLNYAMLYFSGSSSTVNTSIQTPLQVGPKIYTNGGISFDSGTNILANYATSTWTPTIVGQTTAGTTTYTNQTGYYTRVGNMVFVEGYVSASAATGTGNVLIGGLPFTIKNQSNHIPTGAIFSNSGAGLTWPAGTSSISLYGIANSTTAAIFASGSGSAGGFISIANTSLIFCFTLFYQI